MALPESSMLVTGIVYGPAVTSRFGRHLGLNLLPSGVKVCGFNCNFCDLDWTFNLIDEKTLAGYSWPTPEEVRRELVQKLRNLREQKEPLDRLLISGNGEPTLHPEFYDACRQIVDGRDEAWPGLPVGIVSNAATLDRPQVLPGLRLLDERCMRLDAGNQRMFLTMNSPTFDILLEGIVQGLRKLEAFEIQSMFTQGRRDNTSPEEVTTWLALLRNLRPKRVQLHTITHPPADAKVFPVSREFLETTAHRVREEAGVPADDCGS